MEHQVAQALTPMVTNLLCAVLTLLAALALRAVNSLTAKVRCETAALKDGQLRAVIADGLDRIDRLAASTVACLEQTTAQTLRQALKDGVDGVTRQDLLQLGQEARQTVIDSLGPQYIEALGASGLDLESYVKAIIEAKVYELKHRPTLLLEPMEG